MLRIKLFLVICPYSKRPHIRGSCPNVHHEPLPTKISSKYWRFLINGKKESNKIVYSVSIRLVMKENKYPPDSWMDPRLTTRVSAVAGHGVFATAPIQKDEVIVRWGGTLYTTQQLLDGKTNDQTACQIDENIYIADPPETVLTDSDLMNHSCDPNTWMEDEVTISARRDIEPGEEVTADYALWVTDPEYVTIADCHCGSRLCRKKITGDDWKLKEVQERYKGHFPPYLEKRIKSMRPKF